MTELEIPRGMYASLQAIRKASDQLLERVAPDSIDVATKRQIIVGFIRSAIESGFAFDKPSDRRTIQGLIDYWGARFDAITRDLDAEGPPERLKLREFDGSRLGTVAEQADEVVNRMSPQDQEIVKRILLRLNVGPIEKRSFAQIVEDLPQTGLERQNVIAVLRKLLKANILVVYRDPDSGSNEALSDEWSRLSLSYDALASRWKFLESTLRDRADIHELAQAWAKGEKKSGDLLDSSALARFEAFDDLSPLETQYVAASRQRTQRRQIILGAAALAICAAGAAGIVGYQIGHQEVYLPSRVPSVLARIVSGTSPSIEADIRWLTRNGQRLVVRGAILKDLNLKELGDASASNFTSARLINVDFWRTVLTSSNFQQAVIDSVSFGETELRAARFDRAVIKNTSFQRADLTSSVFDGASFCDSVIFSDSNVRDVSFKNVQFPFDAPPVFDHVAWWLMQGFTLHQLARLEKPTEPETIPAMREDLDEINAKTSAEKDPYALALWRNEKAWTLALYGARLLEARRSVTQALAELQDLKSPPPDGIERIQANLHDTEGYIALQLAAKEQPGSTRNDLLSDADRLLADAARFDSEGAVLFRHAIALNALGRTTEAEAELRVSLTERGYSPTHEIHLLKNLIDAGLSDRMTAMMKREVPPATPAACLSN